MADKAKPGSLNEAIEEIEKNRTQGPKSQFEDELERIKKTLDDLSRRASASLDEGLDSARKVGKEIDEKVHENPWMAIGVFAFIAFLFGFLLGRKD